MSKEKDEKISFIKHYQSSIEKSQNQPERVLHCLKKLKNIRIDVNHLKETGIGKTVNYCRKLDGEVAELATTLVEKWKALVSESENDVSSRGNSKGSTPTEEIKKSHHHDSSSDDKKSKSHHHHHSSSSNKDKSSSSSSKHHKHKSHHSSSSSHNGEKDSKSSKKRTHEEALQQDSKENEAKKLKTEAVKSEKSKEQKSSNGHHKKEQKKKSERKKSQEFDESQGDINFADLLASFDAPTSSSSSKSKKANLADKIVKVKSSENISKSSKTSSSKDSPKPSTSGESRKSIQTLTQPPKLLTEKPKLDIMSDIVNELPNDVSIPEYRPLPLNSVMKDYINANVYGSNSLQSRHTPAKNDYELLCESFSSKANKTRVYSGNSKGPAQVPKLFEMCIRVLQENIDYLECTGGVPFDLLKPVLERAKPEQLATIEYYNPYLIDESDVLWRPHCTRKWKYKQPQEMETWREMYDRCTREDEEKLNRLTKHIRHNQEVTSSGIQKTKMAYVDSLVKPPRNVMRKQEQFGTSSKLVVSPAARTVGLKHLAPNLASSGDVRLRVQAGLRDDAQQAVGRGPVRGGGGSMPKKAPMMAKILSKFKR